MKMTWIEAARRGNVSELLDHFADGQKVNAEDEDGSTALAVAVENGQAKAVRELLMMGADPQSGGAPYFAIDAHRTDILKMLLEHGLNPNGSMRGMGSFIEKAVQVATRPARGKDTQACLEVLLKAGADKTKVQRAKEAAGLADGASPKSAAKSNSKSKPKPNARTGKKARKPKDESDPIEHGPFELRRGTLRAWDYDTWMAASVFVGGKDGLRTLATALEDAGATVQRDVTKAALSGKLPPQRGPHLLIVKLKGHDWAVVDTSGGAAAWDPGAQKKLSLDARTRLIWCGHQDTAGATFFHLYDNGKRKIRFETVGLAMADRGDTTFESSSHDDDWLQQFDDENEALQALVREQDAYVPKIFSFGDEGGAVPDDTLEPAHVERIMLAVYGRAGAPSKAPESVKMKRQRGPGGR